MIESLFKLLIVSPFVSVVTLGVMYFMNVKFKEKYLTAGVKAFSLYMALLGLILFLIAWIESPGFLLLDYDDWIQVGDYEFKVRFIIDLLGATYALLSVSLIGIIFRFSQNYLHREEGYFRFIFLLSMLQFGLIIVSFARSLDLLFMGWELVGTTSVLLISYFYVQPQPVVHAFKAIVSYRLCDMGILAASAWAHHYLHSTDFVMLPKLLGHAHGAGPLFVGIFVIWASLAKAGQLPMSSWLPTAMEGPTPSSAIFYGALSVHLGPFLLIRFHDYLAEFPPLLIAIGVIGAVSAFYATMVGRTRSDAKTMLAYSTITQVGIIYVEISMGFTNFAMFHMVTHASLRTFQFLRSSSIINDFTDNPAVEQFKPIQRKFSFEKLASIETRKRVYVHALHAFHLDFFIQKFINFVLWPVRKYFALEKSMMDFDNRLLKQFLKKD